MIAMIAVLHPHRWIRCPQGPLPWWPAFSSNMHKHKFQRNCTSMHIIGKVWSKPIRFSRYTSILLIYCMIHLFRIDMLACCSTAEEAHLLGVSLAKAHSHLIQRSQHVTCHNNNSRHIFLYFDVLHCFAAFCSTPLSTAQRKMTKTYKNYQKLTKVPNHDPEAILTTWSTLDMGNCKYGGATTSCVVK